tara:strand:- start:916 stop:1131 length:216 start_codon:yes stop_codon:yes gene_type:complete
MSYLFETFVGIAVAIFLYLLGQYLLSDAQAQAQAQAQHEAICLLERKLSEDIHDKHNFPETKVSDDGDVGC